MNANSTLFDTYQLGNIQLSNKTVMAPMTRSRSTQTHIPTPIMTDYYAQRAGAGLIVTEGVAPSPNGVGYPRIPGLYNQKQIEAWRPITKAVHDKGGKIFAQLMHTGRISHPLNMPEGSIVMAPSAIAASTTKMYTDQEGPQDLPTPKEMTKSDIKKTIEEFAHAAKNAIEAGFDGVELHAANGYLIEQFISPDSNQRTDEYGGSIEGRVKFALEVAEQTIAVIGAEKVGIRLSPYGAFNDINPFSGQEETFTYLAKKLGELNLVYLHLVDHSDMGAPEVPRTLKEEMRDAFGNTVIISGGYDRDRAENHLKDGLGHLVAFGKPFLANPDLVERMKQNAPLNQPDFDTLYTPGEKGYTDYPVLEMSEV
ncbi:N-ethylmaleimide reductase [Ekhidna lutea]|uniref:N-ethylmaleimide reductase n=1 Tax=Ekhidna lutea TaxID=447679 RepID=A0A239M490_EKHLU|nr:alkene reductase [Ekhidna lutea]SNT37042.1 N-ethylmaleimide reductase [Ekhidna lutea]